MILRYLVASALSLILNISHLGVFHLAQAGEASPRVASTPFNAPLFSIFYFDDSDILLGLDGENSTIYRSTNAGEDWKAVDGVGGSNQILDILPHPTNQHRAYVIGRRSTNWITTDQGATWRQFDVKAVPSASPFPLIFHGRDPQKVIFQGRSPKNFWERKVVAYYTEDDFNTISLLREDIRGCIWATGTPQFGIGTQPDIATRIFCISRGLFSPWPSDNRLMMSDDHFKSEKEVMLADPRSVNGIISMLSVKKFLVAAARAEGTDELAFYVSHDASQWHQAKFGNHKVLEEGYTVLESTNYSMQVDVKGNGDMGTLFTSNSDGVYFTKNIEHTNRGPRGVVDFEKITGVQGIVLVNVVDNSADVDAGSSPKHVVSQISFDDGRTFQALKVGAQRLHLHSVTERNNVGMVFSSPAPGIVMGVGNTGDRLSEPKDGNLYVSDDAGVTWKLALEGPHKYEFGDQGAVIMAIKDEPGVDRFQYSLNHGQEWAEGSLGSKVDPRMLMTLPDSTSLKFLLQGVQEKSWIVMMIDFANLHERKCEEKDFERWPARVDNSGQATCLMGHKQFYRRRKADAGCFVAEEFRDPQPETERCKCTKQDFECDFDHVRSEDQTRCVPLKALEPPKDKCGDGKGTFSASSGFRKIPGNDCEKEGGEDLEKETDRPCSGSSPAPPPPGGITHETTTFKASLFSEWHYLERTASSSGDDESIVMRTSDQKVWLTKNHGKGWAEILKDQQIMSIYPHPYFNDAIYFLTKGKDVHYSLERGDNMQKLEAPAVPHPRLRQLHFHPEHKDSMIWTGVREGAENCGDSYYTKNRHTWNFLRPAVKECQFISKEGRRAQDEDINLVFCEQYERENPQNALQLVSSSDWFDKSKVHFEDILHFATMSEFTIVATKTEKSLLNVDASVDGHVFAPANFPPNFQLYSNRSYTALDSSTHAIFLHVTANNETDREYGTIIKSNSNGTFYSLAVKNVNRDASGLVDFEKMQGIEGVAMVNVVDNVDGVESEKQEKKLKSKITHNDGADWVLIPGPGEDPDGKPLGCVASGAEEKCSLHLHSYTERFDKSATFSSRSATGIMMAVGNVGEHLQAKESDDTYTFITTDGGIHWAAVRKGAHLWAFGDQGSIIVICEPLKSTQMIYYTLDEGRTWESYKFSDRDMHVLEITTMPSDNSRNFLLWGKYQDDQQVSTVNIDFTGLSQRQRPCVLQETKPEADDYYLWEPSHPSQDNNCLFGHVAQYHRKRLGSECFNGNITEGLHRVTDNCLCTRRDFECGYNYERLGDGTCSLVPGLEPADAMAACRENSSLVEYHEPTGYRRIPLTTCQGGLDLDQLEPRPCPGHETEYMERHSISGVGLFFAIIMPIAAAAAVGYYAWTNWRHKLSGFGSIQLGESVGASSFADRDSPLLTVSVAIIAGAWAVAQATPLLVSSLWRSAKGYVPLGGSKSDSWMGRSDAPYTSRGAFSARRQDYHHVVEDEDELLGNDLDEGDDI